MALDPRQLEALSAVAEHGSFGVAAQALAVTVAAVSLRIKSLEAALGMRLLVRGKKVRPTPAGQTLLTHIKQVRLMEADVIASLTPRAQNSPLGPAWQSLPVAINADSVATWFLPGVAPLLCQHHLLLDVVIDDQDHTHDALKSGEVVGCVSTLAQAIRGCEALPLGIMRYKGVATEAVAQACRTAAGRVSPHKLLNTPAVIFNRKDALQDLFLEQHLGLRSARYPRHFMPAIDAFETAIAQGLGWGMVPELHLQHKTTADWVEVIPGSTIDVPLYWHHWLREPLSAQQLTKAVQAAAHQHLRPMKTKQ